MRRPSPRQASSPDLVKLVDMMLADGVSSRASDIHVEPVEGGVTVRYRIDGVLRQVMTVPRAAGVPLISRIKIMSGLDIADRLRPQDGRARYRHQQRQGGSSRLDPPRHLWREGRDPNSQPEVHGPGAGNAGALPEEQRQVERLLGYKEGIILVTGPTGSGKTTTLYSALRVIQGEGVNIVTIEDPVEFRLGKHIVQVQINEKAGLTFSTALRSILRQDPDVVLVGEIRDGETAQIAVQASLTGHLVLSTLHTNDAPNSVTRLVDMGMQAYKIGAALRGVIAQRLMRRLCPVCRVPMAHSEVPARLRPWIPATAELWKAVGCGQCTQTGYRGRFSVVEILVMTPEMERLVGNNAVADEIGEAAKEAGMQSLFDCALRHMLDGETTVDELIRVAEIPHEPTKRRRGKAAPRKRGRRTTREMTEAAADVAEADPGLDAEELLADIELVDEVTTGSHSTGERKATILLVEDEDTLRRVMKDLLEQEGYLICEARDGAEAFEQVDRHNPDLVLLDLNLPNVDGYTVLAQLRSHARTADLPIVVLSARGDEDNEVRVLRLGATDFLTKPFRPRALSARLEATLARHRD